MTSKVIVRQAELPQDKATIDKLCWDYRDALLELEGVYGRAVEQTFPPDVWQSMLDSLPRLHSRPKGAILLAERSGEAVGCGMIHPLSVDDAEIKRVYVATGARGLGLGEMLTRALVEQARTNGYQRILMDTTKSQTAAARLYEKVGFKERGSYAAVPATLEGLLLFFELEL